jgi:hypothetical protein
MRKICAKFYAVLHVKHKTLLVLRVFCAISNGSALFCSAQNAQKQCKTAHFARIRKEMQIPGSSFLIEKTAIFGTRGIFGDKRDFEGSKTASP